MALVLGIDPGMSGAFALLDSDNPYKIRWVEDMPVVKRKVGKTMRERLDFQGLRNLLALIGEIPLITLEDPGARPKQAGQMAFGRSLGAVEFALWLTRNRVEMIVPTVWKPALRIPKDKKEATCRAEEIFPQDREMFRGPRGGALDGRAEAALIALYGAKHLL